METRINELGRKEVKVQPDGLPAIWFGLCQRCDPYNECLGFRQLSYLEWHQLNSIISKANSPEALKETLEKFHSTHSKSACTAL